MAKRPGVSERKLRARAGRPPSSDTVDARKAIVQAARRLLEDKLPAQATNSLIAREAGVDPALIRYYFGDRASLFLVVVEEIFKNVRLPAPASPMTPEAFFEWRVGSVMRFARSARSMQRLMIDELAESDSPIVKNAILKRNAATVALYKDMLKSHVGHEIAEFEPLFLYIAVLGMCEFFTAAQSIVMPLSDPGSDPMEVADRYEKFIINLLLNGIRKR